MAARYSDAEIDALLTERKPLPNDYMARLRFREKSGHKEAAIDLTGANGSEFRLILRQNNANLMDFSVILAVTVPGTNRTYRLRRYNGKSHEHSNKLDGKIKFYDFHIHTATERYPDAGLNEDAYAQPSSDYFDLRSALQRMFNDCNFVAPVDSQQQLFGDDQA